MARERAVGWMARRERGACPQRPVTREQRRQTVQRALALRVALAFCRFGRATQLFRLSIGVFDLAAAINQFRFQRFFSGKNPPIRDGIAQAVDWQVALFSHDAEKFIVRFHDKILHRFALLRRHGAGAVEQVFKLSTFENDGGESHFVEKLFIIEGLNDHTNAAGDRRLVSHEIFAAARDIVATRRGQRIHVYHHWFPRPRFDHGVVNHIRGRYFTTGRIDFQNNTLDPIVIARLLQSHAQIVNHVVAGGPGNGTADQTAHDDDRYAIGNAASAPLHYYLAEFCQRLFPDHAGTDMPEDSNGQENINDHARAKRQEQKERETTELTICHDLP